MSGQEPSVFYIQYSVFIIYYSILIIHYIFRLTLAMMLVLGC